MNPPGFSGQGTTKIVVQGHLDEQSSYWLEGLTLTTGFDKEARRSLRWPAGLSIRQRCTAC
jgi:hypothetical protein